MYSHTSSHISHVYPHMLTCSHTFTRFRAHMHTHTRPLTCSHICVLTRTGVCSHHLPLPAGGFVLKLPTHTRSGELTDDSHPDGGRSRGGCPRGPPATERGPHHQLKHKLEGAPAGSQARSHGSLEDGQIIPNVLPGHESLSMACLSPF